MPSARTGLAFIGRSCRPSPPVSSRGGVLIAASDFEPPRLVAVLHLSASGEAQETRRREARLQGNDRSCAPAAKERMAQTTIPCHVGRDHLIIAIS